MAATPIITLEFSFPDSEQNRVFVIDNPVHVDVNAIHPDARINNTSFGYSGRHDHGSLPLLRSDGPMAEFISALSEAKQQSDVFLSAKINEIYGYKDATEVHDEKDQGSDADAEVVRSTKKKRITAQ